MSKRFYWEGKNVKASDVSPLALRIVEAANEEKRITAKWYQRISGNIPWEPGERELLNVEMDVISAKVNRLIQENAVEKFASLPEESDEGDVLDC